MTQENYLGMKEVIQTYQRDVNLAEKKAGGIIRERVKTVLSAYGGNLPPELILCGAPDIYLNTQTYELVNISSQRPRPLSDIAWFMLRDRIAVALERVTTSQSI